MLVKSDRGRGEGARYAGRDIGTAMRMIAPPTICSPVIASPSTPQANRAETGGRARRTSATTPTGVRPMASDVSP